MEATKIRKETDNFGLHSCRVGALTEAANSGKFSNLQLQNLGRWAQMDSAARYILPREKEQAKVGQELGNRLVQSLGEATKGLEAGLGNSLEAACNLQASKVKASISEGKRKQEESAKKRASGLERQVQKVAAKKDTKKKLLFRARKTGPGEEDWQALPARRQL